MIAEFGIGTLISFGLVLLLGVAITILMCVFLLAIHEYGHIAAMMRYGIRPDFVVLGWPTIWHRKVGGLPHQIGLFPIFGCAYAEDLLKAPPRTRAIVALAGPVTSLILGLFLLAIAPAMKNWLVYMAGMGSLILAGLNMVPLPPMDGWYVAEYGLSRIGVSVSGPVRRVLFGVGIFFTGLAVMLLQGLDLLIPAY